MAHSRPYRLEVRTSLFQGENTGSSPVGATRLATQAAIFLGASRPRLLSARVALDGEMAKD
jgi:hypothetical protein